MRELSLNVLDVAQNSVSAGAKHIEISVEENTAASSLVITIRDDGCGMDEETLRNVRDPFFTTRTTRKVGMGIPLFQMAAEMTGGSLQMESAVGAGTTVTAAFRTDHVDFTPLGDIGSTVVTLITMNTGIDFLYTHKVNDQEFTLSTRQLRELLGGVPLDTPEVILWMQEYVKEQTQSICGGVTEV